MNIELKAVVDILLANGFVSSEISRVLRPTILEAARKAAEAAHDRAINRAEREIDQALSNS